MSSPESKIGIQVGKAMLLVCDAAGKVQAVTSKGSGDTFRGVNLGDRDFAEIFGRSSSINSWFTECVQQARQQDEYAAEATLDLGNGSGRVFVTLESLRCGNELYGFALQLCPNAPPRTSLARDDGDSIITRKQWHEIKNHIGALRLYATFLKRKMPDGDEREIVEKMLSGVNALIGYLDKIRRGDSR
jgi:nitrogen-specific signal transduction histidine kinase